SNNGLCVAYASMIISTKWTPLLLFALAGGVSRFSELQAEVGVNPRTLSARLNLLEQHGIISKSIYNEMPPHVEYVLTQKGHDLLPILESMTAWGQKHSRAQS